jgi:hypothetical protein
MRIDAQAYPLAGDTFRFSVQNAAEGANLQVFVDSLKIFDGDCLDPPCHEEVRVPDGTRGSMLRIIATAANGTVVEREFEIAEVHSKRGPAASAT